MKKGYTMKIKNLITTMGLAGLLALTGCSSEDNNAELKKFGFRHLSKDRIEYANGYEAQGFDTNKDGKYDAIQVMAFFPGETLEDKSAKALEVTTYRPGDNYFSTIEENILGKSKPLDLEEGFF